MTEPLRARRGARLAAARGLPARTLTVAGQPRTYLLGTTPGTPRPTVVALHGGGGQAAGMVGLTDLARRGAEAGFATAFPDGLARGWNDGRTGARLAKRAGVDDAGFLVALADELVRTGVSRPGETFFCGISNGAFMSDHLARVAPDHVAGIGLVAGTANPAGLDIGPGRPPSAGPMPVMSFHGDADPLVPYGGGPVTLPGPGARRRAGERGLALGAEATAADWARRAGCDPRPLVERLAQAGPGLGVVRLTWMGPAGIPIVLHRIEGGGHTWPGGPQYLPSRFIGPTATGLDATGILLGYFQWVLDRRAGQG